MQLVFVDETTDKKFKDYLGLSIALVNARFYPLLKRRAKGILQGIGWDETVEFKGSYLFSASSGCTDIQVENRIIAAGHLLDLNVAKSNCRMTFYYGRMKASNHAEAYLGGLPGLLSKALPKAPSGAGKDLLAVVCDQRPDVSPDQLHEALVTPMSTKGYVLLERPTFLRSSFDTVGLMFADLVGYLAGRIDTISNDAELFEGLTEDQLQNNGKIRKLRSSTELIEKIRQLSIYTHASMEKDAA